MAVRVQPESSMPVPPVPTMMPAESVDPVVQIPYHELPGKTVAALGGSGFGFLHLTVSGLQLRIFQGHERLIYHCSRGESM